jgi:hypothetical protein
MEEDGYIVSVAKAKKEEEDDDEDSPLEPDDGTDSPNSNDHVLAGSDDIDAELEVKEDHSLEKLLERAEDPDAGEDN